MVEQITMNVNETLELDYLIEEVSRDTITVSKDPKGSNINYVSKETGIFDPQGTGTYELNIDGQTIEIEVTDRPENGVARWPFDDANTESVTAFDVWGNNNGTINGPTTGVSGANQTYTTNEAYLFDGDNDFVSTATRSDLGWLHDEPHSISFWISYTSSNGTDTFIGESHKPNTNAGGTTGIRYGEQYKDGGMGDIELYYRDKSGNANNWVSDASNLANDGNFHHITIVFNTIQDVELYVDGQKENMTNTRSQGYNGMQDDVQPVYIGAQNIEGSDVQHIDGAMDDVRLYNKALTNTEVSNLYNNGNI